MDWLWHRKAHGICIEGCRGDDENLTVPAQIEGEAVKELLLGRENLGSICRSLRIPEGVEKVSLDLRDAENLERLSFPASAHLVCSPRGVEKTPWFRSHGGEGVYLGGYYCGTPLGGGELLIADGTVAIARGADFHCLWENIVLPDSVKIIEDLAFADAKHLKNLRLPPELSYIGDFAFHNCPKLGRLFLPDSISCETAPFMMCTGLRELSVASNCPIKTKFSGCPRIERRSSRLR